MARLLEALKAQGVEITEAVEAEILKEFTEKKDLDAVGAEVKDLKQQLEKRDLDIEELKKTKPEDLTETLKTLQHEYETAKTDYEEKIKNTKLEGELKVELMKAGPKDVDILTGLVDKSMLKMDKEGKISGLSEQLEKLKADKAFLFEDAAGKENKPGYEYKPDKGSVAEVNTGSLGDAIAERMGLE